MLHIPFVLAFQKESKMDIAIVYATDSTHLAGTFCGIVDKLYPGLNISVHTVAEPHRFTALDTAHRIVIFVSENLLSSEQHLQELHLALNRQRSSEKNILYLIQTNDLTSRPFFPRVLPYNIVCSDSIWKEYQLKFLNGAKLEKRATFMKNGSRLEHASTFFLHHGEYFAMEKAADDVLESLIFKK